MTDGIVIRYAFTDAYTQDKLCDAIENSALCERALRYRNCRARLESLLGAYCVEECARKFDIVLCDTEYDFSDKPSSAEFEFNVSHSHGLAICAASKNCAVGVDTEAVISGLEPMPFRDGVARRRFSRKECDGLFLTDGTLERTVDFFRLWTAHEALGKYLGVGLFRGDVSDYAEANGLDVHHLILKSSDGAVALDFNPLLFKDVDADYYIICVCAPKGTSIVSIDRARPL